MIETDGSGTFQYRYLRFNGMLVDREEANDWVDHYVLDHLGNVRAVYGPNGWDVSDFYPFGGERVVTANSNNRFKFTGKERDTESGLDNFGARFDASTLGRFMSPDKTVDMHREDPQSMNLYAYVRNRPMTHTDPTGNFDCDKTKSECQSSIAAAAAIKAASFDINNPNLFVLQKISDTLGNYGDHNGVTISAENFKGTRYEDMAANTWGKNIVFSSSYSGTINQFATVLAHEATHVMQNIRSEAMSSSIIGLFMPGYIDKRKSWQGQLNFEKEAYRNEGIVEQALHMKGGIYDPSDRRPGAASRREYRIDSAARSSAGTACNSVGDWPSECQE